MKYYKQQKSYTCGPACMKMALEEAGIKKSEKELAEILKTKREHGTKIKSMHLAPKKFNLKYITEKNSKIFRIRQLISQGYSVIVYYFYVPGDFGHYAAVKKVDSKNIYFLDPYLGPKHRYTIKEFKKIWRADLRFEKNNAWLIAIKK